MPKDNLFSTPRETILTGEQMLENAIKRKQVQRQNMKALVEANKMIENTTDFTIALEAADKSEEEELRKNTAMENAYYKQGARSLIKEQFGMKQRLIAEGMEQVWESVLGEIIYDSYWLDEPVKESTVSQIEDSISKVMLYIDNKCPGSKVPVEKHNKLLKNIHSIIESVVKEAAERITQEAVEANSAFAEFELNSEEEAKLDDQLGDLGREEIIELIKDKVAHVVQDEKEKGKERAETFSELEKETSDDESDVEGEEETEAEEATLLAIESGEIALEGASWDTLKIYFNKLRRRASKTVKAANKLYKNGNFTEAKKKYAEGLDVFKDIKKRLNDVDDTTFSTALSWFNSFTALFVTLQDIGTTKGGASVKDLNDAHEDTGSVNMIRQYVGANVNAMIRYCENQIRQCDRKNKENKSGKPEYKYSLESALSFEPTDGKYTAPERYISGLLENDSPFNLFEDPSWNEFKAYVSFLCKKIKNILMTNGEDCYCAAIPVIDELMSKLSSVPEDIPGNVKESVMAMVSLIYGAVPPDEVIISRMGGLGSPDLASQNPIVNYATTSWVDLLVNIKTNLSSIKSYCESKCVDNNSVTDIPAIQATSTFESMVAHKKSQMLTRNMGSTLFEAMMIGNISETETIAMESGGAYEDEEVEDAALIETLLQYTVFETYNTLGLYKFRLNDIKGVKADYIKGVTEGKSPIYGDSDSNTMSNGKDKTGKKKVRIKTRKMRTNKTDDNDNVATATYNWYRNAVGKK